MLDPTALRDLEEQLGGPEIVFAFARDYARLWIQRHQNIASAVKRADRDQALDAVISLKVTSAMAGGTRITRLAEALEALIRAGDFRAGLTLLGAVAYHGSATVEELQSTYLMGAG